MGLGLEMFRVFRFGHVFEHTCLTPEFANQKKYGIRHGQTFNRKVVLYQITVA